MRIYSFLLLAVLSAACADTGSPALTEEGGGTGPMLTAGTCNFTISKVGTDPISASANTTGNDAGSWFLLRSGSVGVTLVGEVFTYSGAVTSASHSSWVSFPYTLPTPPQTIDADLLFGTGEAGDGSVGMTVRYKCADGTDTLMKSFKSFGSFGVTVN